MHNIPFPKYLMNHLCCWNQILRECCIMQELQSGPFSQHDIIWLTSYFLFNLIWHSKRHFLTLYSNIKTNILKNKMYIPVILVQIVARSVVMTCWKNQANWTRTFLNIWETVQGDIENYEKLTKIKIQIKCCLITIKSLKWPSIVRITTFKLSVIVNILFLNGSKFLSSTFTFFRGLVTSQLIRNDSNDSHADVHRTT